MDKSLKNFKDFADTREAGAEKIAGTAKEKGGLALLTWHHFKVKLPYYKKAAAGKFDIEEAKKEFKETYAKISTSMSQIEFQREVGRLEVLGELIIKNGGNAKSINESIESSKTKGALIESTVLPFCDFVNEKRKTKNSPDWKDSDAPDANGKFKELGVKELAKWLIRTRGGDMRKITGSLNQQIVFNRNDNPTYAKKMESVRAEVKRQLGKKDKK
jgi:hypothetical protein